MIRPARLQILTYHRVLETADPLRPAQTYLSLFETHLSVIRRFFHPYTLSEAMQRLSDGTLPWRSIAITFDDGYLDNATIALPMLERFGLPATFFVASGFLNDGVMWNDRVIEALRRCPSAEIDLGSIGLECQPLGSPMQRAAAIKRVLEALKYRPQLERDTATAALESAAGVSAPSGMMMSPGDVRRLHSAGMEVGAHTVTHPILCRIGDTHARREIADSKQAIESIIDADVTAFAYPNGRPAQDFESRHAAMVAEAGFDWAVTTAAGPVRTDSEKLQLGRYAPYGNSGPRLLARFLRSYFDYKPATA